MFVRGQRMNFRMAKMDDLPQLKVVYEKIIEEMNCNNIKIWDEIYPLLHMIQDFLIPLFFQELLKIIME